MKTICITNRQLCRRPLWEQLERVLCPDVLGNSRTVSPPVPEAVLLREKDLSEPEYRKILCKVKTLCNECGVLLIAHTYADAALSAGVNAIHFPMPVLREIPQEQLKRFSIVGASTHSVEEAREAVHLGASYVTASHVFPTDCKKDLPPRGLDFLSDVCGAVSVPVYALGGIHPDNAAACIAAGAAGVCMMSEYMKA